ncbi:hypothetical protein J6590_029611 [Homalodisca vitripennis]|nr:hypothetical protein J6590_029611 [Homalodisca vitripennis]
MKIFPPHPSPEQGATLPATAPGNKNVITVILPLAYCSATRFLRIHSHNGAHSLASVGGLFQKSFVPRAHLPDHPSITVKWPCILCLEYMECVAAFNVQAVWCILLNGFGAPTVNLQSFGLGGTAPCSAGAITAIQVGGYTIRRQSSVSHFSPDKLFRVINLARDGEVQLILGSHSSPPPPPPPGPPGGAKLLFSSASN